jgi:uncharacterized cupin superfamily protein
MTRAEGTCHSPRVGIAHRDDIEGHRAAKGEMDATWHRLGSAAGTKSVGVNIVRVAPGKLPTPPHSHGASEEIFFVLGGSGLAWQDDAVHEVRAGDCVVHVANTMEHTFVAGPEGLEYVVFGLNHPTEFGWLPRSGAVRLGWPWVEGRIDDPWALEAAGPPLEVGEPAARPPNIVSIEDATGGTEEGEVWKELAASAGSVQAGLNWSKLEPGRAGTPLHCHSEEEEVYVILEGDGTLELVPSPVLEARGGVREDVPVRAGHVVARPGGTKVAHALRAGDGGLTYLAYGTRKPNDICWYPTSQKVYWRGIGVIARVEPLDYWDGEPR